MSNIIDKNLFNRDPLLGSLLLILDSVPFNCKFVGTSDINKSDLPAFTYAVNDWYVEEETINSAGSKDDHPKYLYQNIMMAIFKDKPDNKDECTFTWNSKFANEDNKRTVDMSFKYPFERWKTQTFLELMSIIDALTCKGDGKKNNVFDDDGNPTGVIERTYLADIFGFEIINSAKRNFIYIQNETNNELYGVGAIFTLKSCFIDCCPKFDKNNLSITKLKKLGYTFESL